MSIDIEHWLRVAKHFEGTDLYAAAYMHDMVEDGVITEADLRDKVTDLTASTVMALTRRKDETYVAYIQRVNADPAARAIKIADITDNLARMDDAHRSLEPRYRQALKVLLGVAGGAT